MVDYTLVFMALQTLSIMVGVIYHIMTLRNTRKNQQMTLETRQTQLFLNFFSEWRSKEMNEIVNEILNSWEFTDYDDFNSKYGHDVNPDAWNRLSTVIVFFEGLGLLVQRGVLDFYYIDFLMGIRIFMIWEKMENVIMSMRAELGKPLFAGSYEYLYKLNKSLYPDLKT